MFNKGAVVNVIHPGRLGEYEWTVLNDGSDLLGCPEFPGHSGVADEFKGTVWDGHCYYIPRSCWVSSSPLIQENE